MVYLLYTLDELKLSDGQRQAWVALIQSFQDPKTGWFGGTSQCTRKNTQPLTLSAR